MPLRWGFGSGVAAALAVVALSGCGAVSSLNPFSSSSPEKASGLAPAANTGVCPTAVILQPLANTVVFGPGEGRRPINVAFNGRLSEVDVKCDFGAGGAMRVRFDVVVVAERGPAGHGIAVDLDYFVAVTAPDQAVLSKKNVAVHIEIPPSAKRAAVTDHFEETINTGGRPSGDLTIDLGFQQSPDVVQFYRNLRPR